MMRIENALAAGLRVGIAKPQGLIVAESKGAYTAVEFHPYRMLGAKPKYIIIDDLQDGDKK